MDFGLERTRLRFGLVFEVPWAANPVRRDTTNESKNATHQPQIAWGFWVREVGAGRGRPFFRKSEDTEAVGLRHRCCSATRFALMGRTFHAAQYWSA